MSSPSASNSSSTGGSPPPLPFSMLAGGTPTRHGHGPGHGPATPGYTNGLHHYPGMQLGRNGDMGTPNSSSSGPGSTASSDDSPKQKKKNGIPYIPSYMDLTNGPEPCVVCGDAATGYHYRCMTCEGCKGFFRRTIQKDLEYHCKYNDQCNIDKNTRNQCQQCRFRKCITVGMATDLVLNERQRVAKRKLIEDNRERRRTEARANKSQCVHDHMTEEDKMLIGDIMDAYEETQVRVSHTHMLPPSTADTQNPEVWRQLNEVLTPCIIKVVEFAKRVPGFSQLMVEDQILLLKSCCMEVMLLRTAVRFDRQHATLCLPNGMMLTKESIAKGGGLGVLIEPIFEFAESLAKLELDDTEVALLATVLLMQADRPGLKNCGAVERLQDAVLGAYKRYLEEKRPSQPVHWAKILMKVTDLRTISARHAERVLSIKLDKPSDIPPLFLQMFDESRGGAAPGGNGTNGHHGNNHHHHHHVVKPEPEDLRLARAAHAQPDTPARNSSR